jgi:hypothetical protein
MSLLAEGEELGFKILRPGVSFALTSGASGNREIGGV